MSHSWNSIRLHAKRLTQTVIWSALNRHRPSGLPDIWIFGCRRSGSTLLREVIARNPGVKSCDQPFSVRSSGLHDLQLLQAVENGPFLDLYPELEAELKTYIGDIIAGRLHVNEVSYPWKADFKFVSDRLVFKATDIPLLADWIEAKFSTRLIFLVRHPLSQALSTLSNNWIPRHLPYLANRNFVETYLTTDALRDCETVARQGPLLLQHVLTWCCENVALYRQMHRSQRGFIPYEDMVAHVEETVAGLSSAYGLTNTTGMTAALQEPSASSFLSTREARGAIRRGNTELLLSRWRKRITPAEESEAMAILGLFGIDLYRTGDDFATVRARFPIRSSTAPGSTLPDKVVPRLPVV